MPYEYLKIEKGEGIAVVTLDRPPVNSLNVKAYQEIYDAFCECEKDDSVGAVILTGAGDKIFTAGLDVKEVAGKINTRLFCLREDFPGLS
jgi:enoyl-CoA hydratase/carnithine racemase